MNELTKNSRRQRLLDENITTIILESEDRLPDHTTLSDRSEAHTALKNCMKQLTSRTQKIVDARYFKDKNSSEIGAEHQLAPVAIRKILFTARKSLSDCLRSQSIHHSTTP